MKRALLLFVTLAGSLVQFSFATTPKFAPTPKTGRISQKVKKAAAERARASKKSVAARRARLQPKLTQYLTCFTQDSGGQFRHLTDGQWQEKISFNEWGPARYAIENEEASMSNCEKCSWLMDSYDVTAIQSYDVDAKDEPIENTFSEELCS